MANYTEMKTGEAAKPGVAGALTAGVEPQVSGVAGAATHGGKPQVPGVAGALHRTLLKGATRLVAKFVQD